MGAPASMWKQIVSAAATCLKNPCWIGNAGTRQRECGAATGWGVLPIEMKKISGFWLSTDQLLWTGSFPVLQRAARAAGVFAYWAILAMALLGWSQLRARNVPLARTFLFYALFVTAMHVPFVMNTRLRMPLLTRCSRRWLAWAP